MTLPSLIRIAADVAADETASPGARLLANAILVQEAEAQDLSVNESACEEANERLHEQLREKQATITALREQLEDDYDDVTLKAGQDEHIAVLEGQVAALSKAVGIHDGEVEVLVERDQRIAYLLTLHTKAQDEARAARDTVKTVERNFREVQERLAQETKQHAGARKRLEEVLDEINSHDLAATRAIDAAEAAKVELNAARDQIDILKARLTVKANEGDTVDGLRAKINEFRASNVKLLKEIEAQRHQFQMDRGNLEDTFEERLEAIEEQHAKDIAQANEYKRQADQAQARINSLEDQRRKARDELEEAKEKARVADRNRLDVERNAAHLADKAKARNKDMQRREDFELIEKQITRIERLEADNATLRATNNSLINSNVDLRKNLDATKPVLGIGPKVIRILLISADRDYLHAMAPKFKRLGGANTDYTTLAYGDNVPDETWDDVIVMEPTTPGYRPVRNQIRDADWLAKITTTRLSPGAQVIHL